ncbi:MAG: hypothetical protein OWU33_16310 [Firmicutes bacterium]|nr:hypothetical protein [Bacillota bacterium]
MYSTKYVSTGASAFAFRFGGTFIAQFNLPNLHLERIVPVPSPSQIAWGAWATTIGRYTYIYGVNDSELYIARTLGDELTGKWAFYTGSRWSWNLSQAAPVLKGVSNELSVIPWRGLYILVTSDATVPLSPDIVLAFSRTPVGPFEIPTLVYVTPGTTQFVFTYNALAHPELSHGNQLVLSYNRNSLNVVQVENDVAIYRPRFVVATLHPTAIRRLLTKGQEQSPSP